MCSISHSIITQYANVFQTLEQYYLILGKGITSTCRPGFKRTHIDTHTLSLVQPGETNRSISATCTSQELTITVSVWGEDDIWKDFSRFQHRWAFSLSPSKISTRYSSLYNQIQSSFFSTFFKYHRFTPSLWNLTSWNFHSFTHFGFRYM